MNDVVSVYLFPFASERPEGSGVCEVGSPTSTYSDYEVRVQLYVGRPRQQLQTYKGLSRKGISARLGGKDSSNMNT